MLKFVIDLVKLIVTLTVILVVLKVLHCNVYIDSNADNIKNFITVTRDVNVNNDIPEAIEEEIENIEETVEEETNV